MEGFNRERAEANRSQENSLEVRLATEGLIIQASEVLHPQSYCLRDLIRSTSTGLRNNPLSMTVMGFLGLNVEVLAGIAAYCNVKFPENAMNGTNIAGANITGANILRNTTETRHECMEEKIQIAMLAIPSFLLLGLVIVKISDSFKSRRSGGEAREGAPQNEMTNRVNQQANTTHLVADIAMVPNHQP